MADLYAAITGQIVDLLQRGVVPWHSGIAPDAGAPRNFETNRPYRGLNVFLLSAAAYVRGFKSPCWLTFRQIKARGGFVRKGEKATVVIFWKQIEVEDDEDGQRKTVPVLRYYHVFNLDQTEGIPLPETPPEASITFNPIAEAERIIRDYEGKPTIIHEGSQPYYELGTDKIVMPAPERFTPREEYYATLFHELIHSTGHHERLNRTLEQDSERPRTPVYAREELIAEMGAAFLCGQAHIAPAVLQNQAAYIDGWLRLIWQDHKLLFTAASAAQKAADWVLEPNARKSANEQPENAVLPTSSPSGIGN